MGYDQISLVQDFNRGTDIFRKWFLVAEIPVRITVNRLGAWMAFASWIANEVNVL